MFAPPRTGEVVLGRYRIEGPLGSGGMGIVLRATHLGLNQLVAMKFMAPSAIEPEIATERFLREAQATFRLRSEHTVRVLDAGTLPNGAPVMVMELLEGQDLKAYIAAHGPLGPAQAVSFAVEACDALAEAHTLGIVHRDLKARNLFIARRVNGTLTVKVLDFGISKIADTEGGPLTMPDTALGSPRYMAPEQWQSAATVDARADIYALGAVTYEMLTGKIPLAGLPLEELIKRIAAGSIPSPKELRPDLPDALCRVVLKALRPYPDERYPTAVHFAAALKEASPAMGMPARPKPNFAHTAPTAIVDAALLMAQARIAAAMGAPPAPASTDDALPSTQDAPISTTLTGPVPAHEYQFDEKTAVSAGSEPVYTGDLSSTLQVAQVPAGFVANLQNRVQVPPAPMPPAPPPAAPPPSSVLAMGLRDSVSPGHMNATIAMQMSPQPLPPPPAPTPMQPSYPPPPMHHSSSYGPPPPAQGPSWQPPAPVYPSMPPAPQPEKSGFPWLLVGMMVVILLGFAAGLTTLLLLRR